MVQGASRLVPHSCVVWLKCPEYHADSAAATAIALVAVCAAVDAGDVDFNPQQGIFFLV